MILNIWTITSFFLAGVGFLLAALTLVVAVRGLPGSTRGDDAAVDAGADRGHLLLLLVGVLGGVRLLAWPHFYVLLGSYVPDLAGYGVMCAFGVTLIQPALVTALEWIKPVLVLALGFWWLLAVVDRAAGVPVLRPTRAALAVPIALLAMAECAGEVVYLVREKVGRPVTCCTQFLDTGAASLIDNLSPLGAWISAPAGGSLPAALGLNALAIGGAWTLARSTWMVRGWAIPAVLSAVGVANLFVTHWCWIDVVAPRVLQLPYHHCLYELITDFPAFSIAALLTVLGNGGLAWPLLLGVWRRRAPDVVAALQRRVYALCAVALASAALIVAVHMF